MYLFSGQIKCMHCGKHYRGKADRSKKIYICSGYSNRTSDCERFKIEEEDIVYTIRKHFDILEKSIDKPVNEYVKEIQVRDRGYRVHYKDNSHMSIIEPNKLIF